jgi:hypothetical protein
MDRGIPDIGMAVAAVRREAEAKPTPIVVADKASPGMIEGGVEGGVVEGEGSDELKSV